MLYLQALKELVKLIQKVTLVKVEGIWLVTQQAFYLYLIILGVLR